MILRLLKTVPSSHPDFPFQPGQVINVPRLTAEMRKWLKDGSAAVIREETQVSEEPQPERAVLR